MKYNGIITPMITPFDKKGEIDYAALIESTISLGNPILTRYSQSGINFLLIARVASSLKGR